MSDISKVVFGNDVLIDLTQDTVSADNMLAGTTAHGANGDPIVGNLITHNVIDNLTSTSTEDALSANQGRVLKEMIDTKGGGGSVIRITCPEDYVGNTITFAMVGIDTQSAVVGADLVVEFTSTELGTATVTNADTEDSFSFEIDTYSLYEREFSMYGYEGWLESASIPDTFGSLEAVLQSESTLRTLFTKHASVDYLVEWLSNDADTADTILNTDLVAKWVNLRDYALDGLWAVASIKAVMDTADKYGYGEWVLKDDVWQPKGNVPIMTSNSAPYGEVSRNNVTTTGGIEAFGAFDGNDTTFWRYPLGTGDWIQYQFSNPVCIKKIYIKNDSSGGTLSSTQKLQLSNDGITWNDFNVITINTNGITEEVENNDYYLYARVLLSNYVSSDNSIGIKTLQFYGRELKVSVPTMTSNTEPWGEAIASSQGSGANWGSSWFAYRGLSNYGWSTNIQYSSGATTSEAWVGYDFGSDVLIKQIECSFQDFHPTRIVIGYSSDKNVWNEAGTFNYSNIVHSINLSVENGQVARYWRIALIGVAESAGNFPNAKLLQFYGLDYSEHEERHWIYDHGVELENLASYGNITKNADNIFIAEKSAILTNDMKTISNNGLIRAKYGDRNNIAFSGDFIGVGTSKTDIRKFYELGYSRPISTNLPNNYYHKTSANVEGYCTIATYFDGNGYYSTITEWWLE